MIKKKLLRTLVCLIFFDSKCVIESDTTLIIANWLRKLKIVNGRINTAMALRAYVMNEFKSNTTTIYS